jgi:hypothetical protein
MQWRYLDIPYFRYHVGAAYYGEEMVGIGIWRYEYVDGITIARLCDFAAVDDFAAAVIATLVAEIKKQDVCFVDFFKTGPYFSDALDAAGFFRVEHELENIPTLFAPLAHKRWRNSLYVREQGAGGPASELSDINNYYFTKGDSDRDYPTEYYCQQLRAAAQR